MHVLLIDPGHGGPDPGCHGNGLVEKDVNLAVALKLHEAVLGAGGASLLSRADDTGLTLAERALAPNVSLALVLHCDTSPNPVTGHLRTYARGKDAIGMGAGTEIALLAPPELGPVPPFVTLVCPDDWTHRAYNVLYHHHCPAVLIEMGFLSHPQHATFLASDQGQLAMVSCLMAGLVNWLTLLRAPSSFLNALVNC